MALIFTVSTLTNFMVLWTDKLIGDAIDAKTGISSEIEWKLFTPFIE
jgi:hypothetical protein